MVFQCIGGRANAALPAHASRNNPFSRGRDVCLTDPEPREWERERGRGEGGRGGAPLSNDRVARFPRSRFDCLVRQGDLACNCRCCFQTYETLVSFFCLLQRPPSSSLSYPGAGGNEDARSPGSGGTPGPLSAQAPASLDSSDPGKWFLFFFLFGIFSLGM